MAEFLSAGAQENLLDNADQRLRDPRPTFTKFMDFYKSPSMSYVLFMFGMALFLVFTIGMFSSTVDALMHQLHVSIIVDACFILFLLPVTRRMMTESFSNHFCATPFCSPDAPKELDKRGNFIMGKSRRNGVIVAFSKSMLMTHALIFGGTGSGKSETIFTMLFNSMMSGSGGVICDGKADASLPIKVFGMARRLGREHDILMLSYIMGSKGQRKMRTPIARSNTMNPLVKGSASFCSEFMLNLMTSSEGDNAIFSKRAESFVKAYMRIMEYLRDSGRMNPFIGEFAEDVSLLTKLAGFCADKTIPKEVRQTMRAYLITTHGSMDMVIQELEKGVENPKINQGAEQQHGFISMQLIEPLSILGQDYGHIFNVREYDIDMMDVMVNRRILLALIPALEKSQESLQGLGKVVIATMKAMLAEVMDGGNLTGTVDNIINKRPTNSPMAFPVILDEVGYYMVPGIAVIPAQARSLGVGFVFAGQDKPAFTKLVDTEADSIIANTLIKMTGILEDETTGEIFIKRAGKTYVAESTGTSNEQSSTGDHSDSGNTNIKEVDRLDIRDLYRQKSGQFLIMNEDRFDFVQIMYMGSLRQPTLHQVNQKVPMPTLTEQGLEDYLAQVIGQEEDFSSFLSKPPVVTDVPDLPAIIDSVDMVLWVMLGLHKKGSAPQQENRFGAVAVPDRLRKNKNPVTQRPRPRVADTSQSSSSAVRDSRTEPDKTHSSTTSTPVHKKSNAYEQHDKQGSDDLDVEVDILDCMDKDDIETSLGDVADAVKLIDPNASDDTSAIMDLAKKSTCYPSKPPFDAPRKRTRHLGGFMSELKSKIGEGRLGVGNRDTNAEAKADEPTDSVPPHSEALDDQPDTLPPIPDKKPVSISSDPMSILGNTESDGEEDDEDDGDGEIT